MGRRRKKSKGPKKLNRAQYEELRLDLTRKLALLRFAAGQADDINHELKTKIYFVENDHKHVSGHLGRVIADKNKIIKETAEKLFESEKLQHENEVETDKKIKELEAKYIYKEGHLMTEIQLLRLRMESWQEYCRERDCLLHKFQALKYTSKKKEQVFKKRIYEMEENFVVDKEKMKLEVNASLNHLSSECLRSTQIRQAAYARRLLRENIDLRALMQVHIKIVMKLIRKSQTTGKNQQNMVEEFESMVQLKKHLEQVITNKQAIIVNLNKKYTNLKCSFIEMVRFSKIYGDLAHDKILLQNFNWTAMSQKVVELCEKADLYKAQLDRMLIEHEEQDIEILKINMLITKIKDAVQLTVSGWNEAAKYQPRVSFNPDQHDFTVFKQNALLTELIDILSSHRDSVPKTPSASSIHERDPTYQTGYIGIVPLQSCKERRGNPTKDGEHKSNNSDRQIVPIAKKEQDWTLMDVQSDSDHGLSTDEDDVVEV